VAEQHRPSGSAVRLLPLVGRTARYTGVGAICAVVNNVVMILGGCAGGHYVPLSFLSFGIVTPLAYFLQSRFTFKTRPSLQDFFRFASAAAAAFPLYFVVMTTLCAGFGLAVALAAPIATITLFLWNYTSAHWAMRDRIRLRQQ
jgi:putative flippase GtrA